MLARVLGIQSGVRFGKIYGYPRILDFRGIAYPESGSSPLGIDDAGVVLVLEAPVAHGSEHDKAGAAWFVGWCAAD